ncbi:hypothetical protein [Massilia sp. 9096]|uniref:hypothetical protein n=1 Tax=Massilia sp. 9096 TaxID=1500894 RepID=UPI0005677D6D|nr:hypothetical protein [Massilia sp. 9096]
MKRRSSRTPASTSQLDLPFAQAGAAQALTHDLAYYVGLCTLFAAHHKRWPTPASTREEFRSARVPEYDGTRIERELRFPSPALEADPAYAALLERCRADGDEVGIHALDPRYRDTLEPEEVAALLDGLRLPEDAGPGTVRYATGLPAHAEDELTLRPGDALRAQALARAGLDAANARVRAKAFALRVRATPALRNFMERIGMAPPPAPEWLADHYLLAADDEGRLFIRYQLLAGGRYAGRFEPTALVDTLAGVYAASAGLGRPGS